MKKTSILFLVLILLSIVDVGAVDPWLGIIALVSDIVCGIYQVFTGVAVSIAAVIFVIAGIKWIASENDPGSRKAAKDTMVHAIVGLIIVSIAYLIVEAVISTSCGAP